MSPVRRCALPPQALLRKYTQAGAYTDCYVADVAGPVVHAAFVEAFYTTAVFKLERLLLSWLVSKPSTDLQARQLAAGELQSFAAWRVEARDVDQLLLADFRDRTRSWLMVAPLASADTQTTCLYFGSAVVPIVSRASGEARMGASFSALLGFHRVYSRVLLRAACARLARSRR
jgi:hypothetical protein